MNRREEGSAVVDYLLVMVLLLPLFLGILQLALVLHVRNTLASAASEGARVAATLDGGPERGLAVTRESVRGAISEKFAEDLSLHRVQLRGAPAYEVRIHARVPALGLGGPAVEVDVAGHAVLERR